MAMTGFRFHFAAAILTFAAICLSAAQAPQPQPQDLCYALVQNGNLRIACQGKSDTIHVGEKLGQFAISTDGTYAAFESETIEGKAKLTVVDLQSQTVKYAKTVNPTRLTATCGQLVGIDAIENERRNLLTWEKDEVPPYDPSSFMCSSDRRVVVGLNASEEVDSLYDPSKSAPVHLRLPTGDIRLPEGSGGFDLSPNGEYVAFCKGAHNLCIRDAGGSLSCIHEQKAGRLSVSDSGGLLYTQGVPFGHAETLKFWRPGVRTPSILSQRSDIWSPQWITPVIAEHLRAWAMKQ